MRFPINVPEDIYDVFQNKLIIDMGRPYINGRPVDESTWNNVKKIVKERCMPCFPIHYPALYIKLHSDKNKLTERSIEVFSTAMENIKNKGCPCDCHMTII